jgi:hypothetical protein
LYDFLQKKVIALEAVLGRILRAARCLLKKGRSSVGIVRTT